MLDKLINPEIITAASKTPLGILALMIVVLGVLAGMFFGRASVQVRVIIFVLIFAGAVAFGAAIVRTPSSGDGAPTPTAEPPVPPAALTRSIPPTLGPIEF